MSKKKNILKFVTFLKYLLYKEKAINSQMIIIIIGLIIKILSPADKIAGFTHKTLAETTGVG